MNLTKAYMNTHTLHPIGPTAYDALMAKLAAAENRAVRIETRLCKLMVHMGIDERSGAVTAPTRNTDRKQGATVMRSDVGSDFSSASVTGGWQTGDNLSGAVFGPVFAKTQDLWNWQSASTTKAAA